MEQNAKPLVSVLMTSYNREKYIAYAIESILMSSYTNFELIIVDDCSKDATISIARKYQERDKRIKIYINATNLGDYPNRNKAASYANGKYIKYIDADDAIYPWGLDILIQSMEKFPEAGWGLCSLPQLDDNLLPIQLTPPEIYEYHNFKGSLFHKAPLSAIFKKTVFDDIGGFSGKRQMSDTEMWHLLSLKHNVVVMPEGVVWYRKHPDQESVHIRSNVFVRLRYIIAEYHFYRDNKKIPLPTEKRLHILNQVKKQIHKSLLRFVLKGQFRIYYTAIKMMSDHTYDYKQLPTNYFISAKDAMRN